MRGANIEMEKWSWGTTIRNNLGEFMGGVVGSEIGIGDSLLLEGKSLLKGLIFYRENEFYQHHGGLG